MLALGSEVGRASQDTAPRLELGLGRGAPGSGKYWTQLRNNSGGRNGSQRFLQAQEARGLLWRYLGAWLPQHPYLPASELRPVPPGLIFLTCKMGTKPIAVKRLSWPLKYLAYNPMTG